MRTCSPTMPGRTKGSAYSGFAITASSCCARASCCCVSCRHPPAVVLDVGGAPAPKSAMAAGSRRRMRRSTQCPSSARSTTSCVELSGSRRSSKRSESCGPAGSCSPRYGGGGSRIRRRTHRRHLPRLDRGRPALEIFAPPASACSRTGRWRIEAWLLLVTGTCIVSGLGTLAVRGRRRPEGCKQCVVVRSRLVCRRWLSPSTSTSPAGLSTRRIYSIIFVR